MLSRHQAEDMGLSLVCLCICLWAPEECVLPAVRVCVCLAALTHWPSYTVMLLLV